MVEVKDGFVKVEGRADTGSRSKETPSTAALPIPAVRKTG
jgi:hypothetical protein